MAEDVRKRRSRSKVLLVTFKYGLNVGRYFKFIENENGGLVVLYSPLGACVENGDVMVQWRGKDTRKWTRKDYEDHLLKVNREERIKAWFLRSGYDPQDLDENVKVRQVPKSVNDRLGDWTKKTAIFQLRVTLLLGHVGILQIAKGLVIDIRKLRWPLYLLVLL